MKYILTTFLFSFVFIIGNAQNLIPKPVTQTESEFSKTLDLMFVNLNSDLLKDELTVFNEYSIKLGNKALKNEVSENKTLYLVLDNSVSDESYFIKSKAQNNLEIRGSEAGIFYGLITLLQCNFQLGSSINTTLQNINDYPAYSWRGMHLDVSRHFFDKTFIKKYIDMLALHKMNIFHWHLTDDQGWRIEIKKYPLLTEIGSKRKETMVAKNFDPYIGDGMPVQGFYTQEDVKEIVEYARLRHITVIPEIEMPGHAQAALAAYPQYSCRKEKVDVLTKWGEGSDVFCTNDSVLVFLQDVLDEVMALFPAKYIHIGGDEVSKTRWKACDDCQQRMKKNNLKNEEELQSYFIRKMDTYITSKGRSMIGWDEILEGGLAPNAMVMSWRGEEGGIAAAKQKHQVIMSPGSHCYFDHYQGNVKSEPLAIGGFTPIEKVYAYQPTPTSLSKEEKKYILGAQANVWTEYIDNEEHVEYMALPRLCALAEVLWTGEKRGEYQNFKERLHEHFYYLDAFGFHYAKSIFEVVPKREMKNGELSIALSSTYDKGEIKYWFEDDIFPEKETYTLLEKDTYKGTPISIKASSSLRAQYFENNMPLGNIMKEDFVFHKAVGQKIKSSIASNSKYAGDISVLNDARAALPPRMAGEWLAWSGENPEIQIDLGEASSINKISIYSLREQIYWIYLPKAIEVLLSDDGKNYHSAIKLQHAEIEALFAKDNLISMNINGANAKFVKLNFTCADVIQKNKPGAGNKPWLFLSEIVVD